MLLFVTFICSENCENVSVDFEERVVSGTMVHVARTHMYSSRDVLNTLEVTSFHSIGTDQQSWRDCFHCKGP